MMSRAVVGQRDRTHMNRLTVEFNHQPVFCPAPDFDLVRRAPIAVSNSEPLPLAWNRRRDFERIATQVEAKHFLEPRSIHPRGGAGVPGPAGLANPTGCGVDVGRCRRWLTA